MAHHSSALSSQKVQRVFKGQQIFHAEEEVTGTAGWSRTDASFPNSQGWDYPFNQIPSPYLGQKINVLHRCAGSGAERA